MIIGASREEGKHMTEPKRVLKLIPVFKSEDEERDFWAQADSTEYVDWSKSKAARFRFLRPTEGNTSEDLNSCS